MITEVRAGCLVIGSYSELPERFTRVYGKSAGSDEVNDASQEGTHPGVFGVRPVSDGCSLLCGVVYFGCLSVA